MDAETGLLSLVGEWAGKGTGEFPTIEKFVYRERLVFAATGPEELTYSQHTWRIHEDGETASHFELGFLGLENGQTVKLTAVHGLDRVETMTGNVEVTESGVLIRLASTGYLGDDRMIRSWREWLFDIEHLHYDMDMATRSVPGGAKHLSADLYRVST